MEAIYVKDLTRYPDTTEKLREKAEGVSKNKKTILRTELATYGNTEKALSILKEHASDSSFLFSRDSNGETALYIAAYYGHTEVVKVLIDTVRNLPSAPEPFWKSVTSPSISFIRIANSSRNTALHIAVSNHNVDIVKLLIEADPWDGHIQNNAGDSPVYLAAKRGYNDIVKLICKTCPAASLEGPDKRTALHAAIARLHEAEEDSDVIEVLIKAAKDSVLHRGKIETDFDNLYEHVDVIRRSAGDTGDTALHIAVRENHLNVVNLLLHVEPEFPYLVDRRNYEFKRPIYIAAERGHKDIVKVLCDICDLECISGPQSESALHAAIRGRDTDCVRIILERAPRLVTYGNNVGWTPLHLAAYYRFDSVLKIIVDTQVSTRYQCVYKDGVPTPLCVAAKEQHTSTVIQLLGLLPALITAADSEGRNILHFAAMKSNKEMIRGILKHCPPNKIDKILNYKDCHGNTPLHLLIREGCFVPELIKHKGVDTMAKNNANWTPLDMLYCQDTIVGEQLRIKKLLEDSLAIDHGKSSTQESLVPASTRWKKDQEFKITKEKLMKQGLDQEFKITKENLMKQGLELYKERTGTQIVVTTLITTVAFTVGLTMPGGYIQSKQDGEGLVVLSKKKAFRVFMVADALALVLSTTSLFLYFLSSMYQDPHKVSKLNAASTGLNIVSIIAMMLTFITGTYVVLSNSPGLAITVCIIGCIFFLIIIVLSFKMLYDRSKVEKPEV